MNRKYLIGIFILLFVASCGAARADYKPDRSLKWDPAIKRETLGNGMRIFLRENHRPEKRVELRLVVKAGSLYEEDGTEGIAHFLEHMAFNGTKHFKAGELEKYFESVGVSYGGDNNAYTSHDRTVYMLTLPCDDLEVVRKGLTAMSDYANGMLFQPDEIDLERGVILEELRLNQGLYMRVSRELAKIAAPGTRWDSPRLTIVGSQETVKKISRDDFLKFYKRWYRPDRMALIIVGDMPVAQMQKLVKEIIEPIPVAQGKPEFPEYPLPDHKDVYTGIIADREMPVGGGAIAMSSRRKPTRVESDTRRDTLESLVYRLINRRLSELKETNDPPFLDAGVWSYFLASWIDLRYGFAATLKMKQEKRAMQAVIREIERARRFGFLDTEIKEELLDDVERARREVKEKDKTFSDSFASRYVAAFINDTPTLSIEDDYKLIRDIAPAIKPDDVKKTAAEMFAPVNMSVGLTLPDWQKKMYKKNDALDWYNEVVAEDIKPYTRTELAKGDDYAKLKPAKIVERNDLPRVGAT
ncbi:MAG TPA: pitrilysin family protein, partial [bacterium]|nr:pitrilysin family protein [bacterium]